KGGGGGRVGAWPDRPTKNRPVRHMTHGRLRPYPPGQEVSDVSTDFEATGERPGRSRTGRTGRRRDSTGRRGVVRGHRPLGSPRRRGDAAGRAGPGQRPAARRALGGDGGGLSYRTPAVHTSSPNPPPPTP